MPYLKVIHYSGRYNIHHFSTKIKNYKIMLKGKILQIIGPVVDVEFPEDSKLPAIFNALRVKSPSADSTSSLQAGSGQNDFVILEVVKHLDLTKVKTISLHSTDGLQRG